MQIAPQTPGWQWVVASESRPNVLYVVKLVNGFYSCDCPGHYSHGHCKHADANRATQPEPQPPVEGAIRPTKVDPALGLSVLMAPKRAA